MHSSILAVTFLLAGALGLGSGPGAPAGLEPAMKAYFGKDCSVRNIEMKLDDADMAALKAAGAHFRYPETLALWAVTTPKGLSGYAFVDNVKGKVRQITYAVVFDTAGEIQGIEILKYRESHGGEVGSDIFRKQFQGKTLKDPITLGRDIRNITGATISCRSVTGGVKSLTVLFERLKKQGTLASK